MTTGLIVLADGAEYGSAGLSDPNTSPAGSIQADLDVSGLSNGNHVFQIIGYTNQGMVATLPVSISCNSVAGNFQVDDIASLDLNEVVQVNAVLPNNTSTDTTTWAVQITNDSDGSTAYTSSGTDPLVHFAWSAKNAAGVQLPSGNYTFTLTVTTVIMSSGNVVGRRTSSCKRAVTLIKGTPNALALLNEISLNPNDDITLAQYIGSQLATFKTSYPSFTYNVFLKNSNPATVHFRKLMRQWLQTTVTDFYIFGHGQVASYSPSISPPVTSWGGANFWGGSTFSSNITVPADAVKSPELHFIIPSIIGSRQYNFVWVDGCASAGYQDGSGIYDISTPDFSWANAFNIGTDQNFSSAFFGWDGSAGQNTLSNGTTSPWFYWREDFWTDMAKGAYVSQAVNYANSLYTADVIANPTDSNASFTTREQIEDDTTLP